MSAKRAAESDSAQSESKRSKTEPSSDDRPAVQFEESEVYKRLKASSPFFVFAGPCVIEGLDHALRMAEKIKAIGQRLGIEIVYKSSFDKANRTNHAGFRGPGMEEGLEILRAVKEKFGMMIITDVHESWQCAKVAEVADVIQIPAFLCRQTELLKAAAETGKVINIKKGQFASSEIIVQAGEKVVKFGNPNVMLCERGTTFGYGDLIVDPRNLVKMRRGGWPVVQDATHAVQQPASAAGQSKSGGQRQFIPAIARMAAAVGVNGFFFETHDNPDKALSDGPNQWPVERFEEVMAELMAIARASKGLQQPLDSAH